VQDVGAGLALVVLHFHVRGKHPDKAEKGSDSKLEGSETLAVFFRVQRACPGDSCILAYLSWRLSSGVEVHAVAD